MTLKSRLRRIGNSPEVVLPKEALAHLKVGEGDVLTLTEPPAGVRLTTANTEFAKLDGSRRATQQAFSQHSARAGHVTGPQWFSREEVLALHDLMLSDYGGLTGMRDDNMPEAALAKPRQPFAYGKPTLAGMAASYAAGVVTNHSFLDGNKRTGFLSGAALPEVKGHTFFAREVDATLRTRALAAREITEADYVAQLAQHWPA